MCGYGNGNDNDNDNDAATKNKIKIVFSDLDGTLIHYPNPSKTTKKKTQKGSQQHLLEFPPSSTGLTGVISTKTMALVHEIRKTTTTKTTTRINSNDNEDDNDDDEQQQRTKFVYISGMRTPTLLQRIPFLPRADAYCSENGGRIFYPVDDDDNNNNNDNDDIFWVRPQRYKVDDDKTTDKDVLFKPFGLREDPVWRQTMAKALAGIPANDNDHLHHDSSSCSFGSATLLECLEDPEGSTVPLHKRDGILWDFARDLVHTHGLVLDLKGYATCFRVNQKQQQQTDASIDRVSMLLEQPLWKASSNDNIASSVNLKCVDFYPSCSGKKNCCLYLAKKFFPEECVDMATATTTTTTTMLRQRTKSRSSFRTSMAL
mmetsp:Transcript_7478/g.14673  ORF Transcript_7478/g.14673 Transcript_7478/m.14673 type:complete len:373 (+) Transcript_7478:519-1637(+)